MSVIRKKSSALLWVFVSLWVLGVSAVYAEIDIYFSPKGGFSPNNKERTITMPNGEKVAATFQNILLDLIERTGEGGTIKIAMYSFSDRRIQEALIAAARDKGIKIKLIMDAVTDWTADARKNIITRVLEEQALAQKQGRTFDFQIKEIYSRVMVDRGRFKKLADGQIIYGTMHEKFGIFYDKDCAIPLNSFCGSANISRGSAEIYAENRVVFRNEPAVGRLLAEEFARLWNEFGTAVTDNCQSERFLGATSSLGDVQIFFNSKPLDEVHYQRLDKVLMQLLDEVNPSYETLDVAMFSFTHMGLASKLLTVSARHPQLKVRLLLDQSQLVKDDLHPGVLGPYFEDAVQKRGLRNFTVRYKWRSNAYAWDAETKQCQLIHFRCLLLHHKYLLLNGKKMVIGSYNWSSSAEFRNWENIMLFDGLIPQHQRAINSFRDEYEVLWNALRAEGPQLQKITAPQVVTGSEGRRLRGLIYNAFQDKDCRKVMEILDSKSYPCKLETLTKLSELAEAELGAALRTLEQATLIFGTKNDDGMLVYQLTD